MEIYKLSDETPGERRGHERRHDLSEVSSDDGSGYLITNMKQGVKNPNRVNVYVNDNYELSLDVAQVVDYKLKIGKVLTETELEELRRASEFGKLYQRALEWVLIRPRSVRETKDYLYRKLSSSSSGSFSRTCRNGDQSSSPQLASRKRLKEDISELSEKIIDRLITRGYLDDRKFAEWWMENRFVKKGVSRKRLVMELRNKGIKNEVIEEVITVRDDGEEIRKIIMKKRARYTQEKLIAYLCKQGFSYDLVRKVVEEEDD